MNKKPIVNLHRFQSDKIKGNYLIKFGVYVLILIGLWIWYQNQMNAKAEIKKSSIQTRKDSKEVELNNFEIEP